jgi:hypothetical protein
VSEYKIDKKVKMPRPSRLSSSFPWDAMDVEDSFFIPYDDVSSFSSIRQTVYASNRKRAPKAFRVVFNDSDLGFGYRVFRTK